MREQIASPIRRAAASEENPTRQIPAAAAKAAAIQPGWTGRSMGIRTRAVRPPHRSQTWLMGRSSRAVVRVHRIIQPAPAKARITPAHSAPPRMFVAVRASSAQKVISPRKARMTPVGRRTWVPKRRCRIPAWPKKTAARKRAFQPEAGSDARMGRASRKAVTAMPRAQPIAMRIKRAGAERSSSAPIRPRLSESGQPWSRAPSPSTRKARLWKSSEPSSTVAPGWRRAASAVKPSVTAPKTSGKIQ